MKSLHGWRSIKASFEALPVGSGTPALAAFGPTGTLKQMAFAIGDSIYGSIHLNHDYLEGSVLWPEIHWTTDGVETNTVKWQLTYSYATAHDTANFPADTVLTVEEAAGGTAWRHMGAEFASGINGSLQIGTVVAVEIERIANGATENTDTVFGLAMDTHHQVAHLGTPNKHSPHYV